jgi:multiple sugar transport system substrate-binding protein
MSHIATTNLIINRSMDRRSFLMNTIKGGALFALTGPLLLSKKALAGEYRGETLSLLLIQPHKISGEVLAKRFEEQTGAKLNVTIVPYDAIEAQASLDVQSGANQFDVLEYWYPSLGSLAENGVLTDVTGLIQRDESQIHTADFIPTIYDPYTLHKGRRWGLPYDGDSHVLFYNTSILERNHVPVPSTWDDYLQGVKTISQAESKNGVYGAIIMGAAVPVIVGSLFANRFAGFGGNFLKSDGSPDIESDAAFKAAKALYDVAPYALPTPVETAFEQALPAFLSGKGAFIEFWTDLGVYSQDPKSSRIVDHWDVTQLPVGDKSRPPRAALDAGFSFGLSSGSKKSELAWEFVKWATGQETALRLITTTASGIDPTRFSTVDAKEYKEFAPKVQRAARAALSGALAWPTIPESPRLMRSLSEQLNKMLAGQQNPEVAIKQTHGEWRQI